MRLKPDLAEAWQGRGDALAAFGRHAEAVAAFAKAVSLKANYAEAYCNAGRSLTEIERDDEALAAFDSALKINPGLAEAWQGRGNVLMAQRRFDEAIAAFEAGLKADPTLDYLPGSLLYAKANVCDWGGLADAWSSAIGALRMNARVISPFALMATPASAADQLKCARIYAADRFAAARNGPERRERASHGRIRIGYLSSDFREHPIAQLMAGVFDHHDRKRFETIAISYGKDDASAMRARLSVVFDRFFDVRGKSDPEVAALIRELEIDIAVDLNGYTVGTRLGALAARPAPLQVGFPYPGTLGAEFIDYVIADRIVVPPEHEQFYAEQIVYLPHYQPNDASRKIAATTPTRIEAGLPADGFVFCSFNNAYKITPEILKVSPR